MRTKATRKINIEQLDPNFEKDVMKMPDGEKISACFQCGICSGACPLAFAMDYTPRQIAEMVRLGLRADVLSSSAIWICSTCYMCYERCPQGVKPTEVMNAVRNLAVKENYPIPPVYEKMASILKEYGWVYDISDFFNDERKMLGLPPLEKPNVKAITEELKDTAMRKLLGKEKE